MQFFKGTYDNVLNDILIEKLSGLGIRNCFVRFIYNLVSNREVHFCFNDIDEVMVNRGLPQGCVLSVLFFIPYM